MVLEPRTVTRNGQRRLDVALVTVTYRGGDCSLRWADAIAEAWAALPQPERGRLRVIAVDNASGDGTAQRLSRHAPWVEVIELDANRGFAAGCNVGSSTVSDEGLVIFLNPDVSLSTGFFSALLRLDWDSQVAAVGPQIVGRSGVLEQSARRFPRAATGVFSRTGFMSRLFPRAELVRHQLMARPLTGPHDVDWVSGACLITCRARLRDIGGFDERYFMYWEDADWCRRARALGLGVRYHPEMVVHHQQGSSSAFRPYRCAVAFHRSAYSYYSRHVARRRLTRLGAAAALTLRCAVKLIATGARDLRVRVRAGVPLVPRS